MRTFGSTDIGLRRELNEDSYVTFQNDRKDWIGVVCDGIGGSAAGEVASRLAVDTIAEAFKKNPVLDHDYQVDEWIQKVLNHANDTIFYTAKEHEEEQGMGTTCVGFILTKGSTYIFNVGDSRVYADYEEGLIQMSEDHNVVSRLLANGEISIEEARTHKQRNTLTNALGVWHVFQIDFHKIESTYKYLLLSSDGLHGYVPQDVIEVIVEAKNKSLEQKAALLIEQANEVGGYDNCTVVLLENDGELYGVDH